MEKRDSGTCTDAHSLVGFFSICTLLALWTALIEKRIWSRHWKRRRLPWKLKGRPVEFHDIYIYLHALESYDIISPFCRFPFCHFVTGRRCSIFDENYRIWCSQRDSWTALPWGHLLCLFNHELTSLNLQVSFLNGDLHKKHHKAGCSQCLTQQKGHWKVITNCNLTLSMLQGTTDQAQNRERGKRKHAQTHIVLSVFSPFALCWHCGPALIEKRIWSRHWKRRRLPWKLKGRPVEFHDIYIYFACSGIIWHHFHPSADFLSATLSAEGGATSSTRNYRIRCSQRGLLDSASLRRSSLSIQPWNSPHSIFKSLF